MNPLFSTTQKIRDLASHWDDFSPEELAEKIIELEGLAQNSPSMKKAVEHLHFKFIFPIALEMDFRRMSFAKNVNNIAKEVLQKDSLSPLWQLSAEQQKEIERYARVS